MMPAGTPILVLKEGTRRDRGKGAQFNNIAAAKAVADAVRSTLGPRGMDKMLVDSLGDVVITNDGVTILKEIDIEHRGQDARRGREDSGRGGRRRHDHGGRPRGRVAQEGGRPDRTEHS